ncbi:MAG: Fic family protein [Saprospiraceae bacterium]
MINKAIQLKQELDKLRPISPEMEQRIMQKFRLDWNYHSNNLEGNSLTYGETKALILFGITANGKPLKDHSEVIGHDDAIKWILEIIKEDRPLSEMFIRELHELILKAPYKSKAKTPDGKPTTKTINIGVYKTSPNHVKTVTGEIFRFATVEETPAKMADLVKWYRAEVEKEDVNPILLAAEFHYKFIRIHPFDDGNGRTARVLMNFILMQFNYPPVIIKTEDKENYFAALRQADAGIFEPFVNYIATNLVHSLEIMLKGAKGEPIEEPDDIDKEIALLKASLSKQQKRKKGKEYMPNLIEEFIVLFIDEFILKCQSLDELFFNSKVKIISASIFENELHLIKGHNNVSEIIDREDIKIVDFIEIKYLWNGLKVSDNESNISTGINFIFNEYSYEINWYKDKTIEFYGIELSNEKKATIINDTIKSVLEKIRLISDSETSTE